jgi:MFS family permease
MGKATSERHSGLHSVYALVVLMTAYVLAFIDRQTLNLFVEPIKHDLALSDTEVSLLQGFSFAIILSLAGLPIGRLIDSRRRTTLLAIGILFWSVMTAGCGLARSFVHLLLCRIGVGVGEATMTPSAYSLIGDYFEPRRLGLVAGIYSIGAYTGTGLALIFGGAIAASVSPAGLSIPWLGSVHGWQLAFLVVGPLGLLVALWMSTLREPQRTGKDTRSAPDWTEVRSYFRANRASLTLVNLTVGFNSMTTYALLAWTPSFLIRTFHMTPAQVGYRMGLLIMLCGGAGTLCAGLAGDALKQRGLSAGRLLVMLTATVCGIPLTVATALSASASGALLWVAPLLFCLGLSVGSGPATLQEITPNRMRGLQHALAVLAANILGLGFGPTVVALVTDYVIGDPRGVGSSLAITLPTMAGLAAICAALALRPYVRSLDGTSEEHAPTGMRHQSA